MTQAEFAEAFGLPISTLRDWEQRRSTPDAPARALLRAIEREPETMRRLLARAARRPPPALRLPQMCRKLPQS